MKPTRRYVVSRLRDGVVSATSDLLSIEEPLLVHLNGQPFATLMRTPGDDEALVKGFLFSEGILTTPADLLSLSISDHPTSQEILVDLAAHCVPPPTAARSVYLSSSCGVCGRSTVEGLLDRLEPIPHLDLDSTFLLSLIEPFTRAQQHFPVTGGVHAAALFSPTGEILSLAEDIGRHNALDKVVGHAFAKSRLPLHDTILVMSSRASFDIIQKAAMAGIPVVATMGAASSLAADLAQRAGLQLYAFLRPHGVVAIRSSE